MWLCQLSPAQKTKRKLILIIDHTLWWVGKAWIHRSTGPVEMLPHVQKLYKTGHVIASQRVQCSVHRTQATPLVGKLAVHAIHC